MKRKEVVLRICALVITVLTGCGKETTSAVETAIPVAEEPLSTEEEMPEAETEAPVVSGELITVGIINTSPDGSDYRTAVDNEMKNTFTEAHGYSASFVYNIESEGQIMAAREFIQDGVDYLLLSATDTPEWDSVLMNAQDAGVRVILFDCVIDVDESLYEAAVVSDMSKEGEDAVNWLKDQCLDEYNIIHLQGMMGSDEQQGRTSALDEQMAADDKWKLVLQQTAGGKADKAQQAVQSVIDSGESFNVIYAENDDMAKGAVAALDKADISHGTDGRVMVVSFGSNEWALEELLAQNWNYDGQRSPFQSSYIDEVIKTIESGGTLAEKVIIMDEKSFDASTITAEDILIYGI